MNPAYRNSPGLAVAVSSSLLTSGLTRNQAAFLLSSEAIAPESREP